MSKRRPSGDGMVRKREDGRWEGRIVIGHKENGDSIFRYIYADTQKELTAKLRQNIDVYQGVDLTEQSRMTLAEWLEQWLGQMSATLRPSTLENYQKDMANHVIPYLGQKSLSQITAADLRKLYDTLKKNGRVNPRPGQSRGLSSTTVHGIHTTLHHALRAAVEQGLIPTNPADEVDPPKVVRQPMNILNEEQLDAFMETIKANPVWYDFFYTELTTGLRRGELLALLWTDLDVENMTISVTKQVNRINGQLKVSQPKTSNSIRTIPIPKQAVDLLILEHEKHPDNPYMFPSPKTGTMYDPDSFRHTHEKILAAAGIEHIRFHDLRHPNVKLKTKNFYSFQ